IHPGDAEAEGEKPDRCAAGDRDRDRRTEPEPRRDAEMNVEGGGYVGAETDEQRVAEGQLPGEAEHDVPCLAGISEVENEDENGQQVVVCDQRGGKEERKRQSESNDTATRNTIEKIPRHVSRFPSRPCGRNNRTSTRIANANMLFADGVN